jgi:putative hydrolase of HD superfamily
MKSTEKEQDVDLQKIESVLEFIKKMEKLKTITRHSWTSSGTQESVAEHSWRLALSALLLEDLFPEVDMKRVMLMCLVHDISEISQGDIPSFLKTDNDEKHEEEAIREITSGLDEKNRDMILELWHEFSQCKTPEAKTARALDMMEAVMQHNQADLSTWLPLEHELNQTYGHDEAQWHPVLKVMREILRDDTVKKLSSM